MKTKFTLAALLLATALSSQTTFKVEDYTTKENITNGSSIYRDAPAAVSSSVFIDIVNISSGDQTYSVKREDVLLNTNGTDEASALFCFGENCYTPGVTEALSPVTVPPGKKTSEVDNGVGGNSMLVCDLSEIKPKGLSLVKYTIFNKNNNASDAMSFTIRYNDPTAGLATAQITRPALSVAPNPAHGSTSALISMPVGGKCNISVYDVLGAVVSSTDKILPAGQNAVPLNIINLKEGVYFVNFTTSGGTAVRRLVVN
jgi:hypothetical protein